jgi:antitoxin ParD1/3/4
MGREVQIFLPDELANDIGAAVAQGEYASEEEIIREAIEEWNGRRLENAIPIERLKALVQEGIDSGPGRGSSIDEIIAEARRLRNR